MRDLSKSMLSFSWALSLLGMKQAISMVTSGGTRNTANALDPITETAVGQLDESMKGIFRSGDNMQGRAVDMMFGMLNPGNWNLRNWMPGCGGRSTNGATGAPGSANTTSTASAPSPASPSTNVNAATAGSAAGWGPMPEDTSQ